MVEGAGVKQEKERARLEGEERLHSHFRWRAQPKRMSCSVGLFMGRGRVYMRVCM